MPNLSRLMRHSTSTILTLAVIIAAIAIAAAFLKIERGDLPMQTSGTTPKVLSATPAIDQDAPAETRSATFAMG